MDRDLSNVTEDEVNELIDEDGDLRDQDEFTKEDAEEDSGSEGEDEEAEEEGAESTLDWEQLPPAAKQAYEDAIKKAEHWEKNHAKLQSDYAKNSNSWKEKERTLSEYQAKAEELNQLYAYLQSNPRAAKALETAITQEQNPFSDLPEHLSKDPAVKLMQEKMLPYISNLEKEVRELKSISREVSSMKSERVQAENKAKLDAQLNASKEQIKAVFGRDATEEEVTKVLEYMVENKFYGNGKAAALAVFGDQFEAQLAQKYQNTMKDKAKKFGTQSKAVSSARATAPKHARTSEEAIMMAMQEQGFGAE